MYLSSWYLPPCEASDQVGYWRDPSTAPDLMVKTPFGDVLRIESSTAISRLMISPTRAMITDCTTTYCIDTNRFLFAARDKLREVDEKAPLVIQYGDAEPYQALEANTGNLFWYPHVPVVKKFRYAMDKEELRRVTQSNATCSASIDRLASNVADPALRSQAIISILNYDRHFAVLHKVAAKDTPWESKKNIAVWRGTLTGTNRILRESRSDEDWCYAIPRCQVVLQNGNSSLIDAKLVELKKEKPPIARRIQGVDMYGSPLDMREMLSYKMIIMVEGNDVSSGLKWALYSKSVVLMSPPSFTSWAMEELLEPWVHYVPINATNVVEQVEWVKKHDAEARLIAQRGQLWIHDLVFHTDAKEENEVVIQETIRRMLSHWKHTPRRIEELTKS